MSRIPIPGCNLFGSDQCDMMGGSANNSESRLLRSSMSAVRLISECMLLSFLDSYKSTSAFDFRDQVWTVPIATSLAP